MFKITPIKENIWLWAMGAVVVLPCLYLVFFSTYSNVPPAVRTPVAVTTAQPAPTSAEEQNRISDEAMQDSSAPAEVNVTRFSVNASAKSGNQITLKLDTDAPNELRLYVMIYRTYKSLDEFTKKPSEEYLAYIETDVSVAELKQGVSYPLNHDEWKKLFAHRQQQSTAAGIKPLAKTVSKAVTVSVGLAKNETMLGTGNVKLAGSAVKKEVWGDKTLKSEQQLAVSLTVAPKQATSLNPTNLDVGKWYMTAQQDVPLMPHYNPPNKMAALAQVKKLPVGTPFKILQRKVVNDEIWYSVRADFNTFDLSGWINSRAISAPGAIGSR